MLVVIVMTSSFKRRIIEPVGMEKDKINDLIHFQILSIRKNFKLGNSSISKV